MAIHRGWPHPQTGRLWRGGSATPSSRSTATTPFICWQHNKSLSELLVVNHKYWMGHAVYPSHACYSDPWRPYSPFLFDQLSSSYHVPPYFQPMSTFQMGIGSIWRRRPPENHPSSWFAAVVGRKRWLLHPDDRVEPEQMMLNRWDAGAAHRQDETSLGACRSRQVIWVPNYWWHETCGLDPFSAGIGGITHKGCCADLDSSVAPDVTARRSASTLHGVRDIPHCREHTCGTL